MGSCLGREEWQERELALARELGRTAASAVGGVATCREGELGPRRGSTGEQRLAGGPGLVPAEG